jgi:RimJ/RimL family protein N-acetyltransferase
MIIRGKRTPIKAITPEEFFLFYTWAIQSEATLHWYGERNGIRIPSLQDFRSDWQAHNFDSSQPEKGRSFVIVADGQPIGQINYNEINRICNAVDIDVLIGEDLQKGKGYGSDAIRTLVNYLFRYMHIEHCELKVLAENTKAIQAYLRIGFESVVSLVENGISWQKLVLDKEAFLHQPVVAHA